MRVCTPSFLALILLFSTFTSLASPRPSINLAERYLLVAANQERAARGLTPLVWDAMLASAADDHARMMAARGTISHHFAEELELSERSALAGARFSLIAENVAEAPLAIEIHDGWMHSEGHRANLLDPEVDAIGIAVVSRHGQLYAVEDFARVTRPLTLADQEEAVALLLRDSGLNIRATTSDARQTCATSSGYSGSKRPEFILRYNASTLDRLPDEFLPIIAKGRYREAMVGACDDSESYPFTGYRIVILLYR
jgi:hypothetical protein